MKAAFLTEMSFEGKTPRTYDNARTEFCWFMALDADHFNIHKTGKVVGYDHVFIIFPKGQLFLNASGSELVAGANPVSDLLAGDLIGQLKKNNGNIHFVQEGPHWWFNDYTIPDQIYWYNMVASCDSIFAHNTSDVDYYRGMFPGKSVRIIPSLMIDDLIKDITPVAQEKAIVGGNFAHWYGGFESYLVASEFGVPMWSQTSHATRSGEDQMENLYHLPRLSWVEWMKEMSTYKYAVHLMPTVAAGTFSLNCAYFGIPCIGNSKVDTQRLCHPELSVDVDDVHTARTLAIRLREDTAFYDKCGQTAKENYEKLYTEDKWKTYMIKQLVSV